MDTFLGRLCEELVNRFGTDFTGVTVVFPTRRAGLFFRSELAEKLTSPVWAPRVLAIQDLMSEFSGGSMPDNVTQLFELFDVYRNHFPEESFDHYYPWGEVMLKDFEELDKSLADPEKVFAVIADMKEIDSAFALESDDLERLKAFWSHFFDQEHTRLKDEFAGTWRHLLPIYHEFHQRLSSKGWCTEGQSFRKVAEQVMKGGLSQEVLGQHIVFAGLYALSKSEETLISHLLDNGKASIYWDADLHYTGDDQQEAGLFLRKSDLYQRHRSTWTEAWLSGHKKSIEVIGVPMEVGQAKVAGNIIHSLSNESGHKPERTAVILPDEHLLFPVLYALPENVQKINVTMGYPLHQTPIYYLFESLIQLQRNIRPSSDADRNTYYYKDVQALLDHPYIRLLAPEAIRDYSVSLSADKSIRIRQSELHAQKNGFFQSLFRPVHDSGSLFSWCKEVLAQVLTAMGKAEFEGNRLESEFISRFYSQLNRLESIYVSVAAESGLETWWGLFRQIIHATKIPFSGEPLEGLQVMGFLESRVLDFEDIVMLSVNEDILPAAAQHPTFIPYGIRKAFGLPTHEDQHAVTAYHFYRLLQRADRIWLLHNTESQSMTSGEPSRFIFQLEEELAKRFPDKITWKRKVIATPIRDVKSTPVTVEKSPDVLQKMARWIVNPASPEQCEARLSATALNNYIACPLKFYFSNVAGIREPDEKQEALESKALGNVLHKAMELLYAGITEIRKEDRPSLESRIDDCLDQALAEKFMGTQDLEGKNVLLRDVLHELILKIVRADCNEAPVRIHHLEKRVGIPFAFDEKRSVGLTGVIDRIDEVKGSPRILDYKTGSVKFKTIEDVSPLFDDTKNKEQFQTIYYAMLARTILPGRPFRAGLFTLKEMSGGVKYVQDGQPLSDTLMAAYESSLREMIREIFDPAVPFSQTSKEDNCTYCSFKEICGR